MKPTRLLLDTNILIDYLAQRQPFFDDAAKLRVAADFGDVELWLCAQSIADVEYILRKAIPLERLRAMLKGVTGFCSVAAVNGEDMVAGLDSGWPDLEDFCIARAAERIQADRIITRDAEGFRRSPVPATDAATFFKSLKADYGIEYEDVSDLLRA